MILRECEAIYSFWGSLQYSSYHVVQNSTMSEVCKVHFCIKPDHNLETLSIIKLQKNIKQVSLRQVSKKGDIYIPGSWCMTYTTLEKIWWMGKGADEGQALYKLDTFS
jgi:hypothetical protein